MPGLILIPDTSPYRYQQTATGKAGEFPELELDAWPDLAIHQYDIRVEETEQPVAQARLANMPTSKYCSTEKLRREQLLALDQKASELTLAAIDKHAPRDALLLGWWDTSRQPAL
ncbi:MAG: hypothetical protein HS120_10270 [Burkholderiales bacterium]|nr:hypothetical protein [Burkholderiales bacterium]